MESARENAKPGQKKANGPNETAMAALIRLPGRTAP